MFKVIGYFITVLGLNGFGDLISHLKLSQNQLVDAVALGDVDLVVMLIQFIKRDCPSAIARVQSSFGHAVVGDHVDIIVEQVTSERQIRRVSRIGRTLAVDEDSFLGLLIEDEESVGNAIGSNTQCIGMLGDKIVVIQEPVGKHSPLILIQDFNRTKSERFYIGCRILTVESDFRIRLNHLQNIR